MAKIFTFDLETDGLGGQVLQGCIYDGGSYYLFHDTYEACEWMTRNPGIYYAHNGGRYDLAYFLEPFAFRGGLQCFFQSGRVLQATFPQKNGGVYIRDSFSLLSSSLAKICKNFGIKHGAIEIKDNRTRMKDFYNEDREKAEFYLKEDCRVLFEIVGKFFDLEELKGVNPFFAITPPSIAMGLWRKNFCPIKLNTYQNRPVFEWVRNSYFGGRTEIFDLGRYYGVSSYDFVSHYPAVMCGSIPTGQPFTTDEIADDTLVECSVRISETHVGPIPYRSDEGKVIFPIGEISGIWWGKELNHPSVTILNVKKIVAFPDKTDLFSAYVDHFFGLKNKEKQEGRKNGPLYLFSKLCLNSLYGKFGTNPKRESYNFIPVSEAYIPLEEGKKVHWYGGKLGWIIEESVLKAKYLLPHISSYITMLGRVKLREYMESVPKENLLYCDTDSMYLNTKNDGFFEESDSLGGMNLDGEYADFQAFLPKTYIAINKEGEDQSRAKGVRQPTKQKILKGESNVDDIFPIMSSLKGLGEPQDGPLNKRKMTKFMRQEYDKRVVLENLTTIPLQLHEVKNG